VQWEVLVPVLRGVLVVLGMFLVDRVSVGGEDTFVGVEGNEGTIFV
jgi:hypothetical protein